MAISGCQVAIIGAGPYGLAAVAHLRAAKVETRIFGRALEFWKNNMPEGMFLRSPWAASHISDPSRALTLDRYHALRGVPPAKPVSLERFVDYGVWFQGQVAPDLDERQVVRVEPSKGCFRLLFEDGEIFHSQRVAVATGIARFANRPPLFDHLPPVLASHSSDHRDFKSFAGKELVVVGGGQSAVESAVLLSENGAGVELVARAPMVRWLHKRPIMTHPLNPFRRVLFPSTDVGPPVLNQLSHRPDWFKRMPRDWQDKIAYRCIRPAASAWLKPRSSKVRITTGRTIVSAVAMGERLALRFDDGDERRVDHVLLATGYRIDVLRHTFLAPELASDIRCVNGYPELGAGLESSVPGLHFLGAPAAWSFGPLMRFVSGTGYTARALTRCVVRGSKKHVYSGESVWQPANLRRDV